MSDYLNSVFEKFLELKPITIIILAVFIIAFVIFVLNKKESKRYSTKVVVYAGLCIAVSFILSYLRLYRWPQGGSITPASMLPMFVFAYFFGPTAGITAGAAYGILQLIQDPYVIHWAQMFLDYPLAFAGMGVAGFFKNNLQIGILAGGFTRFFFSFLSGVIFFGEYAPEGMNVILYSVLVNMLIIGTETAICLLVSYIPQVNSMFKNMKNRL